MKKTILLLLLSGTVLSACKKDKDPKSWKDDLSQYIQRTWYTIDDKATYYNDMNSVVYETTSEPKETYRLNDGEVKYTDADKNITRGSYIISNSNGKNMITMLLNGNSEVFEVVSIDDSLMTWRKEVSDVTYTEDGQQKNAAKKVYTLNMHCPCNH